MIVSNETWTSTAPEAAHRQLVQLAPAVLNALADNDLQSAIDLSSSPNMTPYLVSAECLWVWKRRAAQIRTDPDDAVWVTRRGGVGPTRGRRCASCWTWRRGMRGHGFEEVGEQRLKEGPLVKIWEVAV
ncbi:hypothetical protein ARSEF4850_007500 [Beauveria asiatica]